MAKAKDQFCLATVYQDRKSDLVLVTAYFQTTETLQLQLYINTVKQGCKPMPKLSHICTFLS